MLTTKRLADVAGATGADLSGIATAFGQIQAKGRLQGEELLQLQERGVALADELKEMWPDGRGIQQGSAKGQISAKAAEVTLIDDEGGKYANGAIAQSDTLFGKLSTLQDALQRFGQNVGKVLTPIFKGIIDFLTTITNQINNIFKEAALENQTKESWPRQNRLYARIFKEDGRAGLDAEKERLRRLVWNATIADTEIPELTAGTVSAAAGPGSGKTDAERAAEALSSNRKQQTHCCCLKSKRLC